MRPTGYVSPYDATVVRLLREAGSVIVGKTNMDEFGMGFVPRMKTATGTDRQRSFSTHSIYGPVHKAGPNKAGLDAVSGISAGGSSGGSAVAVASGMCDLYAFFSRFHVKSDSVVHWGPTPAVQCVSPPPTVVSSGSSPPTACSLAGE